MWAIKLDWHLNFNPNNDGSNNETEGAAKPLLSASERALKANVKPVTAYGRVAVPLFFAPKVFTFRPNEVRFLKEFGPQTSVADAAKKAGVPVEFATRFLRRKAVQEFLQDKFQQIAIQEGWTVERWFSEGDKVWRGQKVVTREQLDIWKEFGARILPKSKAAGGADGAEKPQITINIGAVDEAFRRQRAIQAEVVDGVLGTTG